jgi:branched-chain amino acid transport system substrate-binding protein
MTRRTRLIAVLGVLALVSGAIGTVGASAAVRRADPGVTDTEIRVGGVGGYSVNPVGLPYDDINDGVNAYFEMINTTEGGVNGRQLKLVKIRDDASQPVKNLLQTRALVEEDKVFAVMPVATINFSGARYLTKKGVPTFGYHISNDWENASNLFGETGSFTCFDCPDPTYPWLAGQLGAKRVGIIGYSVQIAQDCVAWQKKSYNKYGVKTPYVNDVLAFGFTISSFAADVQKIKEANLDMMSTCMDSNGSLLVKQAMDKAGINIPVQWGEGYRQDLLDANGSDLEGLYLSLTEQPFEDAQPSEGLQLYRQWMGTTGGTINKISLAGWENADLFVSGLQKIGKNVTRKRLIDAINKFKSFSAHGITAGIDWTKAHKRDPSGDSCRAFVKVESGKFVPTFGEPGKPFVCLKGNAKSVDDFVVRGPNPDQL